MNTIYKLIDSNPFAFLIGFVLITGNLPAVIDYDISVQDTTAGPIIEDSYSSEAVSIDRDLNNLQGTLNTLSVSERRIKAQDIEQYITKQWIEASRASGLTNEEYARNELYINYLLKASSVSSHFESGMSPDTTDYKTLYFELTGVSSQLS